MTAAAAARLARPLREHLEELSPSWRGAIARRVDPGVVDRLCRFVDGRVASGAVVYPPQPFAALQALEPDRVRVVVLGQDPYHGPGQAHGLAFSVPDGVRAPPSLRNILAELSRGSGGAPRTRTCLDDWSRQGVLLLNAVLTVEDGQPASHAGQGWELLTDALIAAVAAGSGARAYLLWGAAAQAKQGLIAAHDGSAGAALVLAANHPSPLSARRPPVPFLGCGHFERANAHLAAHGLDPIDWRGAD